MASHPAVAEGTERRQSSPLPSEPRQTDVVAVVWRSLLHPGLLVATAMAMLVLVIAAQLLPQLPDQFRDEPAATARWLLMAANAGGAAGPLMRSLGLFDVLHSLLFRLALALLSLIMALHLADSLGGALTYYRIRHRFCMLPNQDGEPVHAAVNRVVFQDRFAASARPNDVHSRAAVSMESVFGSVNQCEMTGEDELPPEIVPPERSHNDESTEFRILALRHASSFLLQPQLPLGLLSALTVAWLFLLVGWEIQSPILAPGDTYRAPSRNVLIQYQVPVASGHGQDAANVTVQLGRQVITATAASDFSVRAGASSIAGSHSTPGLLVRVVDGRSLLLEPGQTDRTANVGVVLPSPGSEESVLIPDVSLGLRVVRRTDDPAAFIVEVYRGAELRPQQRIDVAGPTSASASADTESVELEFLPLPGMEVTVRHMPGQWLLWTAAALSIAGLAGFLRPPSFALAQIGPWPAMRSVVVLQTSHREALETIRTAIETVGVGDSSSSRSSTHDESRAG